MKTSNMQTFTSSIPWNHCNDAAQPFTDCTSDVHRLPKRRSWTASTSRKMIYPLVVFADPQTANPLSALAEGFNR